MRPLEDNMSVEPRNALEMLRNSIARLEEKAEKNPELKAKLNRKVAQVVHRLKDVRLTTEHPAPRTR